MVPKEARHAFGESSFPAAASSSPNVAHNPFAAYAQKNPLKTTAPISSAQQGVGALYSARTLTQVDNDEDEDEKEAPPRRPEIELDPLNDDSDAVKLKSSLELHRRFPLKREDGWTEMTLQAISKPIDSRFSNESRPRKVYDLHRVPAEVRNRIYELVLVRDEPIDVTKHPRHATPPLLQVCRQVRNEALQIFYSVNTFLHLVTEANTAHLCLWLSSLGPTVCRHITRLAICCEGTVRTFDTIEFGEEETSFSQAWMALAKTLRRNGVPRHSIGTFSDDISRENFEDDEELTQAKIILDMFHSEVIADYLARAGYRFDPPYNDASLYGPRGRNPFFNVPELDLAETELARRMELIQKMKSFRAHQAQARLNLYLANGGTQLTSLATHESHTPDHTFLRAPIASQDPTSSQSFKAFMALRPAAKKSVTGSDAAQAKSGLAKTALDVQKANFLYADPLNRHGTKRRRSESEDSEDEDSMATAEGVKKLKSSSDASKSSVSSSIGMKPKRKGRRTFVKSKCSKVVKRR